MVSLAIEALVALAIAGIITALRLLYHSTAGSTIAHRPGCLRTAGCIWLHKEAGKPFGGYCAIL